MNANPYAQCRSPDTRVEHAFDQHVDGFTITAEACLEEKPACMPNTRNAPSRTQVVFTG